MNLKEKIVKKSCELFAVNGYDNTSIENIIKEVGCSKGGFYHHFKSKEEIMLAVIESYMKELEECFMYDDEKSFIDNINSVFKNICTYKLDKYKNEYELVNIFNFHHNDKVIIQLERKTHDVIKDAYLRFINKAKNNGDADIENPEVVALLCSKNVLWVFEEMPKYIDNSRENENLMVLVNIISRLFSDILRVDEDKVTLYQDCICYLNACREIFAERRETI